ncbi:MAG: OmpH family outer membrane protein [Flavobacterium sp.]
MRNLKKFLIATILFVGFSQSAQAQAKTAHVDFREVVTKMPAMIEAQKQLENLSKTYEGEITTMITEYRSTLEKYEREAEQKTDKENEDRGKELQEMEKRIQEYRQTAQKEIGQKEQDLMNPLIEKARAAIAKVGKAKGFQYVLDSSTLLLADGPDLTADVKKDLGY